MSGDGGGQAGGGPVTSEDSTGVETTDLNTGTSDPPSSTTDSPTSTTDSPTSSTDSPTSATDTATSTIETISFTGVGTIESASTADGSTVIITVTSSLSTGGNLGALTTTYSASGAGCTTIYENQPGGALVYGTVFTSEALSSCMPTNFNPYDGYYYSPGVCPLGYTYACTAGLGDGGTAATCCPSGGYTCRLDRGTDNAACASVMASDFSYTLDVYSWETQSSTTFVATTTSVIKFYTAGNTVYAEGVAVRRGDNDPAWDIPSNSTSAPSGLSNSAKVGIGVGVTLGVLLVIGAIVAAFFIRKSKKRRQLELDRYYSGNVQMEMTKEPSRDLYTRVQPAELEEQRNPVEANTHIEPEPVELMDGRYDT